MNKKYEINIEQNQRQIELLEKYFTIDKERKTVIVFLKYSKASEIFENSNTIDTIIIIIFSIWLISLTLKIYPNITIILIIFATIGIPKYI